MRSAMLMALAGIAALCWGAASTSAQVDDSRLVICVDPLNMPYSETAGDPPGFDVEIGKLLAKEIKRKFDIYWADTGTRGGLGRAIRRSISEDLCNAFMGLPNDPSMLEEMAEKQLTLTKAYMSVGLVLVQPTNATPITGFDGLAGVTTAVQLGTLPQHLLMQKQYKSQLYQTTEKALESVAKGETQAAMLFGPFVGWHIQEHYKDKLTVTTSFERQPEWHWSLAVAVRKKDAQLKEQLDQAIAKLLAEDKIAPVLARYGVHFDPPSTN